MNRGDCSHTNRSGRGRGGLLALLAALLLAVALGAGAGCEKQTNAVALPANGAAARAEAAAGVQAAAAAEPAETAAAAEAPSPAAPPGGAPTAPGHAAAKSPAAAAPGPASSADGLVLFATTEPHRRSTLTPQVGGVIAAVHVRDGQRVEAGEPLVTLDTGDFELRKRQAEAALRAARTGQSTAKREWKRLKKLVDMKAIPSQQFDQVDSQVEGAAAQVAQAQVAVEMGAKALRDAVIRAPYAGVVVKRHVSEGEYAAVMPPTPLVTLEEIAVIDLRVQVPADQMARLQPGTRLRAWFPALEREVPAQVTRVVPALDPRTRTFTVVAEIENPDHTLWSGMFADVRLVDGATAQGAAGAPADTAQAAAPAAAPAAAATPAEAAPAGDPAARVTTEAAP